MSFKICTIGCGNMATGGHGPSYRKYAQMHEEVDLAACCDLDEHKARAFKEKFGFQRCYTDMDLMLDEQHPDAVCLVVPESLTAMLSIKIMNKGYPLLMEKPPGTTKSETIRMIEAAKKNGAANQVAFNRRYMPLISSLKKELDGRFRPEQIHYIRCEFLRARRRDQDFYATAIHGIDTVRYIANSDFKHIRFRYQELSEEGEGVANIYMDGELLSGAVVHLSFIPVSGLTVERLMVTALHHTFYVNLPVKRSKDGKGGFVHMENGNQEIMDYPLNEGIEDFELNGFYHENASFFDDIKAVRKPKGNIESALQPVVIAECIKDRKKTYSVLQ